jgi:hypothetical protein
VVIADVDGVQEIGVDSGEFERLDFHDLSDGVTRLPETIAMKL